MREGRVRVAGVAVGVGRWREMEQRGGEGFWSGEESHDEEDWQSPRRMRRSARWRAAPPCALSHPGRRLLIEVTPAQVTVIDRHGRARRGGGARSRARAAGRFWCAPRGSCSLQHIGPAALSRWRHGAVSNEQRSGCLAVRLIAAGLLIVALNGCAGLGGAVQLARSVVRGVRGDVRAVSVRGPFHLTCADLVVEDRLDKSDIHRAVADKSRAQRDRADRFPCRGRHVRRRWA